MNRWIYYLIGLRFKGVGQTQRYKRPSKFRIAVNIICYILSAIMLSVIFAYGGFWAFLAGGSFFGIVLAFFSSMSVGKDLIYTQAMIAKEQIRGERPLDFNHKLVKLGYVMSFAPVYIIMIVALLVPGGYLWFIPWFPFFVISILLAYMSGGYIEIFNYKMYKYVLCHLGAHLFTFIAGTLIRELLIVPMVR
ncbi:MAG: hypothetical protein IKA02_06425 [Clostridia bacterium]|nr:hypothetical protein [Clostridia bacterium]